MRPRGEGREREKMAHQRITIRPMYMGGESIVISCIFNVLHEIRNKAIRQSIDDFPGNLGHCGFLLLRSLCCFAIAIGPERGAQHGNKD